MHTVSVGAVQHRECNSAHAVNASVMQGPRQDAGCDAKRVNVGVRIATAIYCYAHQAGAGTKVIVSGLRREEEVLQLSGVDYMVIPEKIVQKMAGQGTLQGYNDGLTAATSDDDAGGVPVLSQALADRTEFRPEEVADVSEKDFEAELGMAGLELLRDRVNDDCAAADKVASLVRQVVVARE